jgi:SAM-dependent methyltransferase
VSGGPYERLLDAEQIHGGAHRRMVGGMWDLVGRLQFEHLVANGLTPGMRLLDIGCGALRGGVHFVEFLDAAHYYGLDRNPSLLEAGYDVELGRLGLQHRLPRQHLIADDAFDAGRFGVMFDVALAHSLFTHLPAAEVRRCLAAVAALLVPGGRLFATFYECPADQPAGSPVTHQPGGITTFADRNPFHHRPDELATWADAVRLRAARWGEWGHPRAQRMMQFEGRDG